ncbi:MAG: hypothetical protein C0619_04255 [Desulfuromonas sp.]|jgi:hypothetical protein|nr:MAG: hypothetical protein C0619_04255 [Desulfuromonas sp.]
MRQSGFFFIQASLIDLQKTLFTCGEPDYTQAQNWEPGYLGGWVSDDTVLQSAAKKGVKKLDWINTKTESTSLI